MTAQPRRRGVGLRGRLVAFFVVITVVPLTAAVIALEPQIDRQLELRSERELATVHNAAVSVVSSARARAADLADDLAARASAALVEGDLPPELEDAGAVGTWLADEVGGRVPGRADFIAIVDADGEQVAVERREPAFASAVDPEALTATAVDDPAAAVHALVEVRELRLAPGDPADRWGWVVSGVWADAALLERVGVLDGAAFVADDEVLAIVGAAPEDLAPATLPAPTSVATIEVGGQRVAISSRPLVAEGPTTLVVWTARTDRAVALAVGAAVLLPSVVLAVLLGWLLAMAVIAPVRRAAAAANAIAAGDLSRELEPTGGPELGELATALNTMRTELARRLDELAHSRDQLRGSLDRLGMTLSSSLDLNRTLAVVVETAKDTLDADRALLFLFTPERDALYCKVARGLAPPPAIDAGAGVIGHVARDADPVLLPSDRSGGLPSPAEGEPVGASQLAVPLLGRGRVLGVLSLLRDDAEQPFSTGDLDTIRSFAGQASVAIENVLLHQEARRLSVTDPLTGLWNFRYFQLQADRELESATRFDRDLALVIIDIDHFKTVNDEHGHQVGDVVLGEVARRIRAATRTPDVTARYGGEEFVVLLPGTGLRGGLVTAERIRAAISSQPIDVRGTPVPVSGAEARFGPQDLTVTCSAGVAAFPRHGRTLAALLRSADAAMYAAKGGGRNQVVGADASVAADGGTPGVAG
jgi:two-component system, cell cycle response regulator